jgi:hypothetical protein
MHDPEARRLEAPMADPRSLRPVNVAIHMAGIALITGSLAFGLAILLISARPVVGQVIGPGVAAILLASAALLLLSLPAMYVVQAEETGVLGLAAHALLAVGLLLLVVVSATPLLYPSHGVPTVEHPLVLGLGIALSLGLLLTAIVTFQAGVFPRPAAVLLLGAMAGFFFVFFVAEFLPPATGQWGSAVFGVLLASGFTWIGISMWQEH